MTISYKKGETAIMQFHCAGFITEEEYTIKTVHKDGTITLDNDDDPRLCRRFDVKTGRCLNDDTTFGAMRTLKLKS